MLSHAWVLDDLKKTYPEAIIYRTKDECVNEFCSLAFAEEWVDTDPIEVEVPRIGEDGQPVKNENGSFLKDKIVEPGPQKLVSVGNTYTLDGEQVAVRDKMGNVLRSFAVEEVT